MKKIDLQDLLHQYKTGNCSAEELALLENWYAQWKVTQQQFTDEELSQLKEEVWLAMARDIQPVKQVELWPQPAPNWARRITAGAAGLSTVWKVAAAVATITLGTWLYYGSDILNRGAGEGQYQDPNAIATNNDIAPGKNTATLTLADGKTINLSEAKTGVAINASIFTYNDGTSITSSLRGRSEAQGGPSLREGTTKQPRGPSTTQTLAVTTPRGGQYQVTLPDGTRVWLNADSKISFPSQFIEKERKVLLEGEAYFEVAKAFVIQGSAKDLKKRVPFIVESPGRGGRPGQRVEVLGTHFNISSYANEGSIKTTLLEGSVRVVSLAPSSLRGRTEAQGGPSLREGTTKQPRGPSSTQIATLQPGQQSSLKGSDLQVKAIDPELAIAWKNNKFMFEEQNIKDIMQLVERWYNVEVVYVGVVSDKTFSGSVSRFDKVSKVLSILELTGNVHFKIEGRRITVSP